MAIPQLPNSTIVARFASALLFRNVSATEVPPIVVTSRLAGMAGYYQTPDGKSSGLIILELSLANFASAALMLQPVGVANESTRVGKLAENALENAGEFLNVACQIFEHPELPGFALKSVHVLPPALPPAIAGLVNTASQKKTYNLNIEGYGVGKLGAYMSRK